MFLIPSHIRKILGSVLTESAHDGPHTALIILPHGQVLCSVNNGDKDWENGSSGQASGSSTNDDDEEGEDEDEDQGNDQDGDDESEGDDDEPYIPTPERNRMLRGIVNTQLLESNAFPLRSSEGGGKKRSSLKIECEVNPSPSHPSPQLSTLTFLRSGTTSRSSEES